MKTGQARSSQLTERKSNDECTRTSTPKNRWKNCQNLCRGRVRKLPVSSQKRLGDLSWLLHSSRTDGSFHLRIGPSTIGGRTGKDRANSSIARGRIFLSKFGRGIC